MNSTSKYALCALAASGAAPFAMAQEPDQVSEELTEILVTAQKREESLQDVPLTVNVITSEQIQKFNLITFDDLAKLAPGLDVSRGAGRQQAVSMRGVKYDQDSGTTRTVDIYLNEVLFDPTQALQAQYDIGQFEVLRGPQGTLRAGTGPSGAVLIRTRQPDLDQVTGTLRASYADTDAQNVQGGVSIPIVPGKLAIRIAGLYDDNRGAEVRNSLRGQQDHSITKSGRVSLKWSLSESLNVDLMHQELRSDIRAFRAVAGTGAFGTFTESNPTSITDGENSFASKDSITTLNVAWELPGNRLSYVGSYEDREFNSRIDLDLGNGEIPCAFLGVPGCIYLVSPYQEFQQIDLGAHSSSHELRFERTGDHLWGYRVGAFTSELTSIADVLIDYTGANGNCLTSPGPLPFLPCLTIGGAPFPTVRNTGFFTTHVFNLTSSDMLEAGVRYSETSTRTNDPRTSTDYHATTGSLTFRHRFGESLMAYASGSRSYRPGGIDTVSADTNPLLPLSFYTYEPEKSTSFELGIKGELFGGETQYSLSVYHQEFDDYISRVNNLRCSSLAVCPTLNTNLTFNADALVDGVELEVRTAITDHWTAQFTGSFADARYDDARIPCNDFNGDGVPDQDGAPAVQPGRIVSECLSNNALSSLPKWQISANSTYVVPFGRFDGFVRALGRYAAVGRDPNSGETIPSAFIADFFLGAQSSERGEISLYAKNLFDRKEITRTSQAFGILGNPTGYYLLNVPQGREVGVQIRYDFASGR
jgi:iron complex outermembrane receptor protein